MATPVREYRTVSEHDAVIEAEQPCLESSLNAADVDCQADGKASSSPSEFAATCCASLENEGEPQNRISAEENPVKRLPLYHRRGVERPAPVRTKIPSEIEEEEEGEEEEEEEEEVEERAEVVFQIGVEDEGQTSINTSEADAELRAGIVSATQEQNENDAQDEYDYVPTRTPDPSRHSSPKRTPSTLCCRCLLFRPFSSCCHCGLFYVDTELPYPPPKALSRPACLGASECKGGGSSSSKEVHHIFEWYDLLLGMLGVGLYLADVGTDLWLAASYLQGGEPVYGGLTLGLAVLAYLVNGLMSLRMLGRYVRGWRPVAVTVIMAVLLDLGPVLVTALYLHSGLQSRHNGSSRQDRLQHVEKMMRRNADSCWLLLLEGCLQSAPQLVLQLSILLHTKPQLNGPSEAFRALALLSSWFSLALALAAFRNELFGESHRTSLQHVVLDFLWRLAETGGRVLSIALFASLFRWWTLALLLPHGLLLSGCFYHKNRHRSSPANLLFGLLVGYFSIFSYIQIFYHRSGDEEEEEEEEEDAEDGHIPVDRLSTDDQLSNDLHLDSELGRVSTLDRLSSSLHDGLSADDRLSCSDYYSTIGKFSVLSQALKGSLKSGGGFDRKGLGTASRTRSGAGERDSSDSVNDFFYEHYFRVRYRSCLLYGLFYVENFSMLLVWYVLSPDRGAWYHHWGLVAGLLALPLHALFQRLYRCPELGRKRAPRPQEDLYYFTTTAVATNGRDPRARKLLG